MIKHALLWLAVAVVARRFLSVSQAEFALLIAAAYGVGSIVDLPLRRLIKRNPVVRRAKRVVTAAKAVRRAL